MRESVDFRFVSRFFGRRSVLIVGFVLLASTWSSLAGATPNSRWQLERPVLVTPPVPSTVDRSGEEARQMQRMLRVRRQRAQIHSAFAIATAGLLAGSYAIGIVNKVLVETGSRDKYKAPFAIHRVLAYGATGTYLVTAVVAWSMPKTRALSTKKGLDSAKLHRTLSIFHGITMLATVVTGVLQAYVATDSQYSALNWTHTAMGVATTGLVITAGVVVAKM
jgi:hypothetical protein